MVGPEKQGAPRYGRNCAPLNVFPGLVVRCESGSPPTVCEPQIGDVVPQALPGLAGAVECGATINVLPAVTLPKSLSLILTGPVVVVASPAKAAPENPMAATAAAANRYLVMWIPPSRQITPSIFAQQAVQAG
jgi:hypothetical protein